MNKNDYDLPRSDLSNYEDEFLGAIARIRQKVDMDFSFILGLTAELERIWSLAKNILSDNRKLMEPVVFEALLFLKVNRSYWDIEAVQEAMAKARNEEDSN